MAIIQSTRHVQILVTSREALQVRGEVLLALSPLPVPAPASSLSVEEALTLPVVRLFCDRAQAVAPTFQLTAPELPAVLDLCRRLDGVPLAIELTAAGIRIMSPTNLVARLDRGLDGVLHQGRDRPSRHQTLRQTITWSYDLLTPAEQRLFAHLAVFEGGWTVEAAEAVCADPTLPASHILTLLDAVVMKNLVQRMPVEDGEEPRFQMLTTIRTYAEECLERQPERARIQQQHLQYYAALTDSQRGHYVGAAQITHLNCLEAEQHNHRAALTWAVTTGAGTTGLTLANALAFFWSARGDLDEAQTWFALLLALPDAPPHRRMEALAHSAYLALLQGDAVVRRAAGAASLAIAQTLEDEEGLAHAWQVLTWDFFAQDPALAIHHLQAAHAIWEQRENHAECAITLGILGAVYAALNEYRAATQAYTSSLQQWEFLDDSWGRSDMLIQLGTLALQHGDTERAAALLMTGLTQKRVLRHHEGMAEALLMLSRVAWWQGEQTDAAAHESLRIYRMLGHRRGISRALAVLSDLAIEAGHDLQAQGYLDESSALQAAMEYAPAIMLGTLRHAVLLLWRGQLTAAVACLTSLDAEHTTPGIRCCWVETIALLAYRDAQFPAAARLWGWADQVRRSHELGVAMGPWRMQPAYRHTMDQHLGAEVVATTWAAGGSAPADALIGEAYRVLRTIEAPAADG
jgi:predicted ATPase